MIKFSLKCAQGHSFESWFQSGAAYDKLCAAGHVACPVCGTAKVEKALMAPAAQTKPAADPDRTAKLQALRQQVEANADYVGDNFAQEARAMYLGNIPDRPIYGEAKPAEAKALLEDGVPVLPLPFMPTRKTN